jgi:hypothetical protein
MKTLRILILCLIFSQYYGIKAQGTHVSIDSIYGLPSQAYFNSTYQLYVFLHNYDTADYQGDINIVFDTTTTNTDSSEVFGPYGATIPGDSTIIISITGFTFDTSVFKLGGNVVVVWPVNNNGMQIMITDTFQTNVNILGYLGISEVTQPNIGNNVFPVPASNLLFLPQNIAENNIEHVRIVDILGRQKYFSGEYTGNINVTDLSNGIYFIEIKEKNISEKVFKFIIEH